MRIKTLLLIVLVAVLGLVIGAPVIASDAPDTKVVKEFSILKKVEKDKTTALNDTELKEIKGAGPKPGHNGHVTSTQATHGQPGLPPYGN